MTTVRADADVIITEHGMADLRAAEERDGLVQALPRSLLRGDSAMVLNLETAKQLAREHCAAWTSRNPQGVADRYSANTSFGMNGGEPMTSRGEIAEMASGFMADFPDLVLACDTVLAAGNHMIYAWTFEGHYKGDGNFVRFSGWEEWDLDDDLKVVKSLGWYDTADYERQIAG